MKVRRIDSNNDWTFGRGKANYANFSESVAQRVKTRLQSFINDWFLDLNHGLPWLADMEIPADLDLMESHIKNTILYTEGVSEITSFEMIKQENRKLQVLVTVIDNYGNENNIRV